MELEVHEQARRQAVSTSPGCWPKPVASRAAPHIDDVINAAEVPLRPVEKKTPPGGTASGRTGGHGDDAVLLAPRAHGKGRGPEGTGLYPELAAYRISEGCSPNVQAEVGRLVGLLPIEQARAELARRGLEKDEKAVRRVAEELDARCWRPAPAI